MHLRLHKVLIHLAARARSSIDAGTRRLSCGSSNELRGNNLLVLLLRDIVL